MLGGEEVHSLFTVAGAEAAARVAGGVGREEERQEVRPLPPWRMPTRPAPPPKSAAVPGPKTPPKYAPKTPPKWPQQLAPRPKWGSSSAATSASASASSSAAASETMVGLGTCPDSLQVPLQWEQVLYYTDPKTGKQKYDVKTSPIPLPHPGLQFRGCVVDGDNVSLATRRLSVARKACACPRSRLAA